MSALTLTVAPDFIPREDDRNLMTLGGHVFRFARDFTGEGLWYTTTNVGRTAANTVVPLMLQGDLSKEARRQGLSETHNFSRNIPKPEKPEKTPRVKGEKKASAPSGLLGSFNPFAM